MLKNLMIGTAAVALSVAAMAGSANAVVIDTFETPFAGGMGGVILVSGLGTASDLSVGAGILGGDREFVITHTSGTGFVAANINGGEFHHGNSTSTGTSLLRWDGLGGGAGLDFGLGDVDLTAGGLDGILIRSLGADLSGMPPSTITLSVYTDADSFSIISVDLPLGDEDHYISFAALTAIVSGATAVDVTKVNAIELFASGQNNFDVGIDFIESTIIPPSVPEPASLTLLGAGLMGLGYFGKRRKA